jgi:hypothetical protein
MKFLTSCLLFGVNVINSQVVPAVAKPACPAGTTLDATSGECVLSKFETKLNRRRWLILKNDNFIVKICFVNDSEIQVSGVSSRIVFSRASRKPVFFI